MLAEPLRSILATLPEAAACLHVLEASQPAFTVRVVMPGVEAPADRQATKGPAVATLGVTLAPIATFLRRSSPVAQAPGEDGAVATRVWMLTTAHVCCHWRAVLVVGMALTVIANLWKLCAQCWPGLRGVNSSNSRKVHKQQRRTQRNARH